MSKRYPLSLEGPIERTAECPQPHKVVYRSKAHAKRSIAAQPMHGRDLVAPYLCECGTWHIGHKRGCRKNLTSTPRA